MDWMYEITWDDDHVSYVEQGCEGWFRDGHPDYGCGHGVDLERMCNDGKTGLDTPTDGEAR
jgi:hypothetical protein